jgi:hypothetical protein
VVNRVLDAPRIRDHDTEIGFNYRHAIDNTIVGTIDTTSTAVV